jgi:hypothetical protein
MDSQTLTDSSSEWNVSLPNEAPQIALTSDQDFYLDGLADEVSSAYSLSNPVYTPGGGGVHTVLLSYQAPYAVPQFSDQSWPIANSSELTDCFIENEFAGADLDAEPGTSSNTLPFTHQVWGGLDEAISSLIPTDGIALRPLGGENAALIWNPPDSQHTITDPPSLALTKYKPFFEA